MALPNQIRSARMTNATLASTIDDELGNLEKALADVLGIPIDTNIAAALFEVVAAGLKSATFQDAAADPAVAGRLQRNATKLKWYSGTRVEELATVAGSGILAAQVFS